jgi:CTP synthase (UTP-ammonia lyase)
MKPTIAIIGEYHDGFEPHSALNRSLDDLGDGRDFTYEWIDTQIVATDDGRCLHGCAGIWSAPGSPFKSLGGALAAIRWARLNGIPHLGTWNTMS